MATILVAEDNPVYIRILTFVLSKNGHTVITATHGGEALACLAETPVDLIVADINMPEMDGVTLLKHLRAHDLYKKLPVMVLTASGQDEDYLIAREAGADEVLTKPASSRQLLEVVDRVLA